MGNELSDRHAAALHELLSTFSGYAVGEVTGRRALGLPTGSGKTTAISAWVAACHRLGYAVPIAISAARVEALCALKRDLLAKGIPQELVGLKHSLKGASEPSSNESHLIQLVSHSRIRGEHSRHGAERDISLFAEYKGQPRAVLIFDESLMRGYAQAVTFEKASMGVGALKRTTAYRTQPVVQQAADYLEDCCTVVDVAMEQLALTGDPAGVGQSVRFPVKEGYEVDTYIEAVAAAKEYAPDLVTLLRICQDPVRILVTGQGAGIIWATVAVPPELTSICILDASHPIRDLVSLDPTISSGLPSHFDEQPIKTFERVQIQHIVSGGGRSTMTQRFSKDSSKTAKEFIEIVKAEWDTSRGILLFTYLPKRGVNFRTILEQEMRTAGIDVDAKLWVKRWKDGEVHAVAENKLQWMTYGEHEGTNGMEFCDVVLMVGLLQRSYIDIAAAAQGQTSDSSYPTPHSLIEQLVESEASHVFYQAASRGSCRRVSNGSAAPMKVYLVHRGINLRHRLEKVMPGAVWTLREPTHLRTKKEGGAVEAMATLITERLSLVLEGIGKVSARAMKEALKLDPQDEAAKSAFTRAVKLVDQANMGWTIDGRSFVRTSALFPAT